MAITDSIRRINDAALRAFGREVTYTSQAGATSIVRGILQTGVQAEEKAPGIYALLFVKKSSLSPPPEPGDEVAVDGSGYKIVRKEDDGGDGLHLLLRFHREEN